MRRSGFILMDIMIALLLLATMMTLLAVGLSSHRRTAHRLSDMQAATSLAESALTDLQLGRAVTTVQIERLPGGTTMPGYSWVRVIATVNGRTTSLTGLARTVAGPSTKPSNERGG